MRRGKKKEEMGGGRGKGEGGALDLRLSASFIDHIKSGVGFTFCVIHVLSGEWGGI